jgi:hypothetical protein
VTATLALRILETVAGIGTAAFFSLLESALGPLLLWIRARKQLALVFTYWSFRFSSAAIPRVYGLITTSFDKENQNAESTYVK